VIWCWGFVCNLCISLISASPPDTWCVSESKAFHLGSCVMICSRQATYINRIQMAALSSFFPWL